MPVTEKEHGEAMSKRIPIQDDTELEQVTDSNEDEMGEDTAEPKNGMAETASDEVADVGLAASEKEVAAQLEAAERQAKDHYDRLLRVSADFENYKKRTAREMRDVVKYADEKLAKELLTIVDNLERAIEAALPVHGAEDPMVHGLELTLNELLRILERHHVTAIKAQGEVFDPNFHQAMMQEETDDQPSNHVVRELQKGYTIHERLLRPALVTVSKARNTQEQ